MKKGKLQTVALCVLFTLLISLSLGMVGFVGVAVWAAIYDFPALELDAGQGDSLPLTLLMTLLGGVYGLMNAWRLGKFWHASRKDETAPEVVHKDF